MYSHRFLSESFKNRISRVSFSKAPEVELWQVKLDAISRIEFQLATQYLDDVTRRKIQRYIFQKDRYRKTYTHAALRFLISQKLGIFPDNLFIKIGKNGRLYLENFPLHFNISYSKELAILALGFEGTIGVDLVHHLEDVPPGDWASEVEQQIALRSVEIAPLLSLWCAKEALLKAMGTGFSSNIPILQAVKILEKHYLFEFDNLSALVSSSAISHHHVALCIPDLSRLSKSNCIY